MYKSIVIVLAAIVASLAAFAYAADLVAANDLPRAAKVKTGHIGDTLRLRGSDMTYNTAVVTVWKAVRVPNKDLFGVRLTLRNVRTKYNKYRDWQDTITNCVRLVDTTGRRLRIVRSATDDQIYNIHLELGESAKGWVYFRAQLKQKAKTFQFKVNGSLGYDTGRWSLR